MEYINEEWKLINGYENYSISSYGRVRNDKTGRILRASIDGHGYYKVGLCKDNKKRTMRFHKLVADAFIDNPENKPCIDHINNDRLDNKVSNLRYVTHTENNQNKSMRKDNTSNVKGVSFDKNNNKWRAYIYIDGIKIHLGYFSNIEDAKKARIDRANEVFGVYKNACEQ